uniref:hypothetical protein n=1 Tax=Polynucleobacter sp. TaxID=2029855 RepID=UPI0040483FAC
MAFSSLTACTVPLTKEAQAIHVVNGVSSELVSDCVRLGTVTGSGSPAYGNDIGLAQAMARARHSAAQFPGADTLAVSYSQRMFSGGEVAGVVFDCSKQKTQLVKNIEPKEQQKSVPNDIYQKAKKCQSKGGIWINDSCVINID